MKLSGQQLLALYALKGTGKCVGKDARMRSRLMAPRDYRLRTLLALRKKGLIEHYIGSEWYLTDAGRKWIPAANKSDAAPLHPIELDIHIGGETRDYVIRQLSDLLFDMKNDEAQKG